MARHLEVDDVHGLYAIMPTPATPDAADPAADNTVDHEEASRAAERLVGDGVAAILANGTFGEGATLTWDEQRAFARTLVETVAQRVPVFVGATTLNTRDTISRARALRDLGADGLLLGRPMWSTCDDRAIVDFYTAVATAVPELAIIIYDNPEAFKGKISPAVFGQLAGVPQIIASKCSSLSGAFLADLAAVAGRMRMLPVDREWYYAWRWAVDDVTACWSGAASCGPNAITHLARCIASNDEPGARAVSEQLRAAGRTFIPNGDFGLFAKYNIQLEKVRIDEAGYMKAGPARPPYSALPDDFAEGARESGRRLAALHEQFRPVTATSAR